MDGVGGFDYGNDYGFVCGYDYDCVYDYSFGFDFDYAYGNRKGPHKQSLIVKCLSDFQNIKNIRVLKVRMDMLR